MMKNIVSTLAVAAAVIGVACAFIPAQTSPNTCTALSAESGRRDMLANFAKVLGAGVIAVTTSQSPIAEPELMAGLTNPAGAAWRGKF
eukprot:CAMPEP_0171293968 /NCGR_PEP_ID=MMETSP0816-20121228/2352_1 /TAXON_ID=420281 /ORGANISM="Proboscia inermis, Strain CCAP1064/1" /LENGTH=87 /DNA_ID=CAMNT_0011765341 /DNA_START=45 /DNA_END=305 /DNA_ORIENTATION=+